MREGVPSAAVAANVLETDGGEGQGARSMGMERKWLTANGQDSTRMNGGDRAEGSRVGWAVSRG
eukprot:2037626-Pleurochrysis_carterae.AAC.1